MTFFDVPANAYGRFMGRFSSPLARGFADLGLADVPPNDVPNDAPSDVAVLDVGCGPGMLTGELVRRFGEAQVSAVDPAEAFVAATHELYPAADVRRASAEELPFADHTFAATLAQLVVNFMADPAVGVAEMRRVTRPGGPVSACVWDHGGGRGPLSLFWEAAARLQPGLIGESNLAGATSGQLAAIFERAGLRDVEEVPLTVTIELSSFADWWEPFTYGVGPAGSHVRELDDDARTELEATLRSELGEGPFAISAVAWAARGRA